MIDIGKFTIGDIFDVYAFSPATSELLAMIVDSQETSLTNNQEEFFATGKAGVRLNGYNRAKTATLSGTNGALIDGILGLQTGSDVETVSNVTEVRIPVKLTRAGAAETTVKVNYELAGAMGEEIKFIYELASDNSPGKKYAQAATAGTDTFAYDPATGEITLPTDTSALNFIIFVCPVIKMAKRIHNDTNVFSKTAEIHADVQLNSVCDDTVYIGHLHIPMAKFSGEWEISTGNDAAVQSWSAEALAGCGSTLWDLFIYTESSIEMLQDDSGGSGTGGGNGPGEGEGSGGGEG